MLTADRLKPLQDDLAFSLASHGMFWGKQKKASWLCCSSPWCLVSFKNDLDFFPGDPSHRCRGRFGHSTHDPGAPLSGEGLGCARWGSEISQLGSCPRGLKVCLVYHQLWSRLEEMDSACGCCRSSNQVASTSHPGMQRGASSNWTATCLFYNQCLHHYHGEGLQEKVLCT